MQPFHLVEEFAFFRDINEKIAQVWYMPQFPKSNDCNIAWVIILQSIMTMLLTTSWRYQARGLSKSKLLLGNCILVLSFCDYFDITRSLGNTTLSFISLTWKTIDLDFAKVHIGRRTRCPGKHILSWQVDLGSLLLTWINFNPAWISNCIHYKAWYEIIYPFLNFNGATVEV